MKAIQVAQKKLNNLRNDVIGFFKMRNSDVFELVTNVNENNTIDVIRITQFGAIQQEFNLPIHYGTLKLFEEGKNMNDVLNSPFEFNDFINSFS